MLTRKAKVCLLPSQLRPPELEGRAVAVFDVLRATTTLTAALAAGIGRVSIYASPEEAARAADQYQGRKILAGERRCLPPPGFDRGNSPGAFTPADAGCALFFATTNGTRALMAAAGGARVITAALVNAAAAAAELAVHNEDILLLCAGTEGAPALEDCLGCGAVLQALGERGAAEADGDLARMAHRLFLAAKADLPAALREAQGGRNVIAAGLEEDIIFAARLDALPVVGILNACDMSITAGARR